LCIILISIVMIIYKYNALRYYKYIILCKRRFPQYVIILFYANGFIWFRKTKSYNNVPTPKSYRFVILYRVPKPDYTAVPIFYFDNSYRYSIQVDISHVFFSHQQDRICPFQYRYYNHTAYWIGNSGTLLFWNHYY
jgi:hypothetical protein